jgi:hypothetical protein
MDCIAIIPHLLRSFKKSYMTKSIRILLFLHLIIFTQSCSRIDCTTTNPVFAKYAPETEEYQTELAKQLHTADTAKLRYWLDHYSEKDGIGYMHIYIQGKDLCAKGYVAVTDATDEALQPIIRNKGIGYHDAELRNLKLEITDKPGIVKLVYKSIDGIID